LLPWIRLPSALPTKRQAPPCKAATTAESSHWGAHRKKLPPITRPRHCDPFMEEPGASESSRPDTCGHGCLFRS
jgi:hypothetical protein